MNPPFADAAPGEVQTGVAVTGDEPEIGPPGRAD